MTNFYVYSGHDHKLSTAFAPLLIIKGSVIYKTSQDAVKVSVGKIIKIVIGKHAETPNFALDQKAHLLLTIFTTKRILFFLQTQTRSNAILKFIVSDDMTNELKKVGKSWNLGKHQIESGINSIRNQQIRSLEILIQGQSVHGVKQRITFIEEMEKSRNRTIKCVNAESSSFEIDRHMNENTENLSALQHRCQQLFNRNNGKISQTADLPSIGQLDAFKKLKNGQVAMKRNMAKSNKSMGNIKKLQLKLENERIEAQRKMIQHAKDQTQYIDLQEKYYNLQVKYRNLQRENVDKEVRIQNLERELRECLEMENVVKSLEYEYDAKDRDLKQVRKRNEEYRATINAMKIRQSENEQRISLDFERQNMSLQNELREIRKRTSNVNKLEEKCNQLLNASSSISVYDEEHVVELNKAIASKGAVIGTLRRSNAALNKELDILKKKNDEMRENVSSTSTELVEVKKSLVESAREQTEAASKEKEEIINEWKRKSNVLKEEYEQIIGKLESKCDEIEFDSKREIDALQHESEQQQKVYESNEKKLQSILEEKHSIKAEKDERKKEIDCLKNDLDMVKMELQRYKTEQTVYLQTINNFKKNEQMQIAEKQRYEEMREKYAMKGAMHMENIKQIEKKMGECKQQSAQNLGIIDELKTKVHHQRILFDEEMKRYQALKNEYEALEIENDLLKQSMHNERINECMSLNQDICSQSLTTSEICDNFKGEWHSNNHLYVMTEEQISDSVIVIGKHSEYEKMIIANSEYVSIGSKRFYYNEIEALGRCGNSNTKWVILTRNCTIRIQSKTANARHQFMTFIQSNLK